MNSRVWHKPGAEVAELGAGQSTVPHHQEIQLRVWQSVGSIALFLLAGALIWGAAWAVTHLRTTEPPAASVQSAAPDGVLQIGQPAPDFTLTSLAHDEQSLAQWRGQPVLINFWATWCGPCRREMPELVAAHERYAADGLVILAVNLSHQDVHTQVVAFAEEFQVPFPVLLDVTGEVADRRYGARGLPMSIFIDREGAVRHIYFGALSRDWLDQFVAAIL